MGFLGRNPRRSPQKHTHWRGVCEACEAVIDGCMCPNWALAYSVVDRVIAPEKCPFFGTGNIGHPKYEARDFIRPDGAPEIDPDVLWYDKLQREMGSEVSIVDLKEEADLLKAREIEIREKIDKIEGRETPKVIRKIAVEELPE